VRALDSTLVETIDSCADRVTTYAAIA
jgi:hypothetical protein